jgi:nitrate/nitrite transporter NarK
LHESIVDGKDRQNEEQPSINQEVSNVWAVLAKLPQRFWLLLCVDCLGYSSIHAFYPNMSKFFQEKFGFTNIEAGSISSLPYLTASFTVPVLGSLVRSINHEKVYELGLIAGLSAIGFSHFCYLLIFDHIRYRWVPIVPIVIFGLGHACFTTLVAPAVPYVIGNDFELLPTCLSLLKVVEGFSITGLQQVSGAIRETTGNYTCVSLLLMVCSLSSITACYELAYPTTKIAFIKLKI